MVLQIDTRPGRVVLGIYDVSGRLVRSLVSGAVQESGRHSVEWDGRDVAGAATRTGLYFCRLEAGRESDVRRLVRIR
jgi:flagellar hook assembly protein FlgD